jgi:hypothetical protein
MSKEITIGESGRVKAAGIPMDHLFTLGETFKQNCSSQVALEVTNQYYKLRQGPPDEIRDRFFPRNRGTKELFRSGAHLTRPILKTDQGAGQFLSFEVGQSSGAMRFSIACQSGYCIEEPFFATQLKNANFPASIIKELADVRRHFAQSDLHEAQLAYERLQVASELAGVATSREADVGREALFFIRPSISTEPILISDQVMNNVKDMLAKYVSGFPELAQSFAEQYARQYRLTTEKYRYNNPIYLQADVQIFPDGSCVLDQLQMPDVGLFITTLDPMENAGLSKVKDATIPLAHQVISAIEKKAKDKGSAEIYLLTRKAVLDNNEDVLEQREIQALACLLKELGIEVQSITIDQISALSNKDLVVMLNVATQSKTYAKLLAHQLLIGGPTIYPNPFLKLALENISGYKQVSLNAAQINNLHDLISSVELRGNAESSFRVIMAVDNYLYKIGVHEDVFHLYISSQQTPIACYRYDMRGIQIALSYIQVTDRVLVRNIPISPERAVLFHNDRPLYNVFRFMLTLEET